MNQLKIMFKLKDIRNRREISQNELARLCEMSVTNIQKYEQQPLLFSAKYLIVSLVNYLKK
jgi:transcriptional regulator with XRE-family HTH domain